MMLKKFAKLTSLILSVICISVFMISCAELGIVPKDEVPEEPPKAEQILIFSTDNSVPLTGTTYRGAQAQSQTVADEDKPEVLKDIDVVKIGPTKNVYLSCPYTAQEIEEYKDQGFTHLSFYIYGEDSIARANDLSYINGQWGLLSRDTRGTLFRIDKPTVYSIKVKIATLILEMTDTADDSRADATREEQKILLTSRFHDVNANFEVLYISDMYLTKEPQGTKTTPALWPNDNRG